MFVTQSNGTFSWNHYAIEGEPLPIPSLSAYVLYRDDNNTNNWHPVQGVSGTQTSVTDPGFASYPNGRWRVETSVSGNYKCRNSVNKNARFSASLISDLQRNKI